MWKMVRPWCWTTERRDSGLGGLLGHAEPGVRGRWRHCAASARLHAQAFLYAQAIAEKRITAASLIEDSSAHIPTQNGLYIPQNYDRRFKGWVSARTALASSLNVPAVRTLVMVTPDAFFEQLKKLGLPLRESGATTASAWRWAAARSRCSI
jgi:hypothetical protein